MIVVNSHKIFGEDWFMHTCAQGVNARTRIYALCACVHAWILTKNFVEVHYYHMSLCLKFRKDPSFRCRDICKRILTLKNHQF